MEGWRGRLCPARFANRDRTAEQLSYGLATRVGVVTRIPTSRRVGTDSEWDRDSQSGAAAVGLVTAVQREQSGRERNSRNYESRQKREIGDFRRGKLCLARFGDGFWSAAASEARRRFGSGTGQPNSPATDLLRGRVWLHGSRPLGESGRIRNGIGTAKAVPQPLALSPQSKGNSRNESGTAETTKVAKSAKGIGFGVRRHDAALGPRHVEPRKARSCPRSPKGTAGTTSLCASVALCGEFRLWIGTAKRCRGRWPCHRSPKGIAGTASYGPATRAGVVSRIS